MRALKINGRRHIMLADQKEKFNELYKTTLKKSNEQLEKFQVKAEESIKTFSEKTNQFQKDGFDNFRSLVKEQGAEIAGIENKVLNGFKDALSQIDNKTEQKLTIIKKAIEFVDTKIEAKAEEAADLPIESYDELNVKAIVKELAKLEATDVKRVSSYEASNKNRSTIIKEANRLLETL
jgi:hypothetical protein